jgi:DNA-directed RNA polymerase alpha subunit
LALVVARASRGALPAAEGCSGTRDCSIRVDCSAQQGIGTLRAMPPSPAFAPHSGRPRDARDYEIAELEIPRRARATLEHLHLTTAGTLCRLSSLELLALPGIGPESVRDVRAALALHGLALAD